MPIVHVHVKVKPDFIEAFQKATVANAHASAVKNRRIARFDILQNNRDDPTRFCVPDRGVSHRRSSGGAQRKRSTTRRGGTQLSRGMMAEPRQSVKFANIDPPGCAIRVRMNFKFGDSHLDYLREFGGCRKVHIAIRGAKREFSYCRKGAIIVDSFIPPFSRRASFLKPS